jgi:hypothetical protein
MTLIGKMIGVGERLPIPDKIARAVIASFVGRTARKMCAAESDADRAFAEAMAAYPIAVNVDAANAQHYELPQEFFALVLGPQRKYSCCLYNNDADSLIEAEERALAATASASWISAAAGALCRFGWRGVIARRTSWRCRTHIRSAPLSATWLAPRRCPISMSSRRT